MDPSTLRPLAAHFAEANWVLVTGHSEKKIHKGVLFTLRPMARRPRKILPWHLG